MPPAAAQLLIRMIVSAPICRALSCWALVSLAACATPAAAPFAAAQRVAGVAAPGDALIYVANPIGLLDVYTFRGERLVWQSGRFLAIGGMCATTGGDVFAVVNYDTILKYAHGSRHATEVLSDKHVPLGCSTDPATGNLAVVNESGNGGPSVSVYAGGLGAPKTYTDQRFSYFDSAAYDDRGDLWVDGYTANNHPGFLVLRKGSSGFAKVKLDKYIERPGQLGWDGTDLTVTARFGQVIYRVKVGREGGTVVGVTSLQGCKATSTFLFTGHVLAACGVPTIFAYPAGGPPLRVMRKLAVAVAAVLSQ